MFYATSLTINNHTQNYSHKAQPQNPLSLFSDFKFNSLCFLVEILFRVFSSPKSTRNVTCVGDKWRADLKPSSANPRSPDLWRIRANCDFTTTINILPTATFPTRDEKIFFWSHHSPIKWLHHEITPRRCPRDLLHPAGGWRSSGSQEGSGTTARECTHRRIR